MDYCLYIVLMIDSSHIIIRIYSNKQLVFFLSFSMNYRDFSVKSKSIISLFQTMKIRLMDFHCLGLFFLLYFMNSRLKVLPKRFKCSILV